jgi:protein-disulfide isomerase
MKNITGEAKLLLVMGAIVLMGGGFLIFGPPNTDGTHAPTPTPKPLNAVDFDRLTARSRHSEGAASAPFTVIEFGDFQCPPCHVSYKSILSRPEFREKVRVFFFHRSVVPDHTRARPAAVAAEAAARQGKFWEMADAFFTTPGKSVDEFGAQLSDDNFRQIAKKIGLDVARFEKDRADEALGRLFDEDDALGLGNQIMVTPTFLVKNSQGEVSAVEPKNLYTLVTGKPLPEQPNASPAPPGP